LQVIYHEYVVRQDHGESPGIEEYESRFPRFAESLRRQIELDQALGRLPHRRPGTIQPPRTCSVVFLNGLWETESDDTA
jgi:hypothetical protein